MLDINGQELRVGDNAQLLCEIFSVTPEGIGVRVLNSDMMLLVTVKEDEVLGGKVASSELTAFVQQAPSVPADATNEEVKPGRME